MPRLNPEEIIAEKLHIQKEEAELILSKAKSGGEIVACGNVDQWIDERFIPNCFAIEESGYAEMCVDALKILPSIAATDYGSSRQRDMGQLWADMTRGYLGEYAVKLFLEKKFDIKSELGHEKGTLDGYLSMDIHKIQKSGEEKRDPKLKIGIKAVKWNGIWMDIPGDQFNHSDIHILVKVGAGRDHLFAFFKSLSVFKDKILKKGEEVGALSKIESEDLYNRLPSFRPIPAYICGFVRKETSFSQLPYSGTKGRKHFTIKSWNGPVNTGDLDFIKQKENVGGNIKFEGIVEFSHDSGYLFNTGNLLWRSSDWEVIRDQI